VRPPLLIISQILGFETDKFHSMIAVIHSANARFKTHPGDQKAPEMNIAKCLVPLARTSDTPNSALSASPSPSSSGKRKGINHDAMASVEEDAFLFHEDQLPTPVPASASTPHGWRPRCRRSGRCPARPGNRRSPLSRDLSSFDLRAVELGQLCERAGRDGAEAGGHAYNPAREPFTRPRPGGDSHCDTGRLATGQVDALRMSQLLMAEAGDNSGCPPRLRTEDDASPAAVAYLLKAVLSWRMRGPEIDFAIVLRDLARGFAVASRPPTLPRSFPSQTPTTTRRRGSTSWRSWLARFSPGVPPADAACPRSWET
jgi:hypothetical protein